MNLFGPICSFLMSVTWALGSTQYSRLSRTYSPYTVSFVRAFVGAPLFFIATFVSAGSFSGGLELFRAITWLHLSWYALSMVCSYAFGDPLFLISTRSLGVPVALSIASCFPIWTVVAGYFLNGDAVSFLQVFGILISIFGIVLIVLSAPTHGPGKALGRPRFSSILFSVFISLLWAANAVALSRGGLGVSPFAGNAVRLGLGLCLVFLFRFFMDPQAPLVLPKFEFKRSAWVFVTEGFLGSYLALYGLSNTPLALGTTLSSLAPAISVPIALFLGLEKFSSSRTFGVLIVLAGVLILINAN